MSLFNNKGILNALRPIIVQTKRYRGKVNIQRPQKPFFIKACYLEVTKPYFPKQLNFVECDKNLNLFAEKDIENPFQRILANEIWERFDKAKLIAFYHLNHLKSEDSYKAHVAFLRENMLMKHYGKKTLQMAIKGTRFEAVLDFFSSHTIVVTSPDLRLKKLFKINKKVPQIILLAGIVEGKFVSKDELLYYSNIPNIQTAQSALVHTLNSVGSQIVTNLNAHQNNLVSQLSERAKQLEESNST